MNPGIQITVIYTDQHLLQVEVKASSLAFAACVDTYVDHFRLKAVAEELRGFPRDPTDSRRVELTENVSFSFSVLDGVGHVMVKVELESDGFSKSVFCGKAMFNIGIEPAAIDDFVHQLADLTADVGQSASLVGSK